MITSFFDFSQYKEIADKSMSKHDIAIVGLGPVGCTAAVLFAEAGLNVIVFERDEDVYRLPRAVNLDGEVIRAFQKSGRGQTVQDMMQAVRPGDRAGFANSDREWLFGQEMREFGSNGWQPMNMFDQPELETWLRSEAVNHPGVDAHIGCEVTGLTNGDDGVAIDYHNLASGESASAAAAYTVACDGASSPTRRAFGIGWTDLGYDHDWLVVDVITRQGHTLGNDTVQVCDPDRIQTYVCTKDPYRRWEFKLKPGETAEEMLDKETVRSLIDPWTPRNTYDIRRTAVYQFHAATADRWREGRIFIAGDAAHQTPPFLGQGMNAGMRDIINLAWKFPLVLNRVADDSLLDTYHAERNAHAHDLVDWAVSIGRLMDHLAEVERCQRDSLPRPPEQPELRSSGYGQGREQPPIRDGAVILEQVSNTGSTGYLFSQPIVRDTDGREIRLDELLGPGFAIVAKTRAELDMTDESRGIMDRLGTRLVSLEGLTPVKGHFDQLFDEHATALVRPDRLVFGHTTGSLSLDNIINQLAEKLALTN